MPQSPSLNQNLCSSKRQAGFTLIELLVALGVSAVIAVLAYQAINNMVNVKQSLHQQGTQNETLQRALWWLEQDFSQLAPRPINDALGSLAPAFSYRFDTGAVFTRIAQYPTHVSQWGVIRVGYQLQGDTLYRLTWPVLDQAPDTQVNKRELLSEVKSFEVRLLNQKQQWVESWPATPAQITTLPAASEIQIEWRDQGRITRLFMGLGL